MLGLLTRDHGTHLASQWSLQFLLGKAFDRERGTVVEGAAGGERPGVDVDDAELDGALDRRPCRAMAAATTVNSPLIWLLSVGGRFERTAGVPDQGAAPWAWM